MPIKAIIIVGHGKACPYCGRSMSIFGKSDTGEYPTRDHINPRWRGGGPRIIACRRCNLDKQSKSLKGWHQVLTEAGDDRAPVVAAFIELVQAGGHLRIIANYEREANRLYDVNRPTPDEQIVVAERRASLKAARKGRLKRKRDRLRARDKDEELSLRVRSQEQD